MTGTLRGGQWFIPATSDLWSKSSRSVNTVQIECHIRVRKLYKIACCVNHASVLAVATQGPKDSV